jgi:hypothetical protein
MVVEPGRSPWCLTEDDSAIGAIALNAGRPERSKQCAPGNEHAETDTGNREKHNR